MQTPGFLQDRVSLCRHPAEDALRVEWVFQDAAKQRSPFYPLKTSKPTAGTEHRSGQAGEELAVCFQLTGKGDLSQISGFMATVYSALVPVYRHLHLLSAQAAALT